MHYKSYLRSILVSILFLANFQQFANALNCYECTSTVQPGCADPFNPQGIAQVECLPFQDSCITVRGTVDGRPDTYRDCGTQANCLLAEEAGNECKRCTTDLCNDDGPEEPAEPAVCYECTSTTQPGCGDPFNPAGIAQVECSPIYDGCIKVSGVVDGKFVTYRDCGSSNECKQATANGNKCSLCFSKLCNDESSGPVVEDEEPAECYECTSTTQPGCGEPFNPAGISKVQCSPLFDGCIKISGVIDGKQRTIRDCGSKNECKQAEANGNKCSLCFSKFCNDQSEGKNGASSFKNFHILALLVSLLSFICFH